MRSPGVCVRMAGEEKTEAATPKKRGEARTRGQVAKSMELSSTAVLLGLVLALHSLARSASRAVLDYFEIVMRQLSGDTLSSGKAMHLGGLGLIALGRAVGPLAATALALGLLVNIAQTGPLWAPEALKPNFNKLNPLTGAQRFFSPRSFVELAKSLYKIGLIGYICFSTLRNAYPELMVMSRMDVELAVALIGETIYQMAIRVVTTMLVLAALDYAYQRYSFEKSLRMTKEEVKQESKQTEGSPQIRARIRMKQREMARKRMMADVPMADAVVTNPTHFAVALQYNADAMAAPKVLAKGKDLIALRIRELARENDIPIIENPPLARALYKQVEIGREIPGDLYEAVAEVLAFVYQINEKRRQRMGLR